MADNIGANSFAGGLIAVATLDALYAKGILSLEETRGALTKAMQAIGPAMQTPEGFAASQLIGGLLRDAYSQRK